MARSVKPTLLILPGTLCDARVWHDMFAGIEDQWPCWHVDYRHAECISTMADLALAAAPGKIIPIGISMGGMVALDIWRRASERVSGLVLFDMDPGGDTPERRARRDEQLLSATHGRFLEMITSRLLPVYFSSESRSAALAREIVISMALDQGIGAYAAQLTALATRKDSWMDLPGIDVPVLIACGEDDQICSPELHARMAAAIPFSTSFTIPEAGHLSPLEQPAIARHMLRSWLTDIDKAI